MRQTSSVPQLTNYIYSIDTTDQSHIVHILPTKNQLINSALTPLEVMQFPTCVTTLPKTRFSHMFRLCLCYTKYIYIWIYEPHDLEYTPRLHEAYMKTRVSFSYWMKMQATNKCYTFRWVGDITPQYKRAPDDPRISALYTCVSFPPLLSGCVSRNVYIKALYRASDAAGHTSIHSSIWDEMLEIILVYCKW